jgi:hypothetical protein
VQLPQDKALRVDLESFADLRSCYPAVKYLLNLASDQPNIDRTPVRCFAELLRKQLLNEKFYSLRAQLLLQTINEEIASSTEENLSRASVLFLSTLERYSKTYISIYYLLVRVMLLPFQQGSTALRRLLLRTQLHLYQVCVWCLIPAQTFIYLH